MFRLTDAGARLAARIEAGDDITDRSLTTRLLDAGAIHPDLTGATRPGFSPRSMSVDCDVAIVTPQLGGSVTDDGRITVDDGSHPPLRGASVRLERNAGPAAARNAGRRLATTALIAFVDADVELLDDESAAHGGCGWLDALLPHFDDPTVGLVAPRVLGDAHSSLDLGDEPARVRAGTRVGYVPAAAIVVRAVAFDDVGGFDETLRFGEDVDFVWRLDQAGWVCRYEPASTVWHRPRETLADRLRQQSQYGSSAAPLADRHPGALAPYRSSWWSAGVWSLIGAGHPVAALALAVTSAAALAQKLRGVPAGVSFGLAMRGHLATGEHLARAMRRAWWPIVAVACVVSRRARAIAIAALVVEPSAVPTDLAYGWGVWRGVRASRTWEPLVPRISGWPATRRDRREVEWPTPETSPGRG
jgi:mycofactocin system glycosyltransferase